MSEEGEPQFYNVIIQKLYNKYTSKYEALQDKASVSMSNKKGVRTRQNI